MTYTFNTQHTTQHTHMTFFDHPFRKLPCFKWGRVRDLACCVDYRIEKNAKFIDDVHVDKKVRVAKNVQVAKNVHVKPYMNPYYLTSYESPSIISFKNRTVIAINAN